MSSPEWAAYMQHQLQVDLPAEKFRDVVAQRLLMYHEHQLPLMPGAVDAVGRLAGRWPLGLASSSNREVIEAVLRLAALAERFQVIVSSEEVRTGVSPPPCVPGSGHAPGGAAIGLRRGRGFGQRHSGRVAAGMTVIATPSPISLRHRRCWIWPGRYIARPALPVTPSNPYSQPAKGNGGSTKRSSSRFPPRIRTRTGPGRLGGHPVLSWRTGLDRRVWRACRR